MKICKYINCGSEYSGGLQEKSIYIYIYIYIRRPICIMINSYIYVMTLGILRLISSKKSFRRSFLLNGEKNSVCIVLHRYA